MFYNSISRGLFSVFLKMLFGGLFALAMNSNVSAVKFICVYDSLCRVQPLVSNTRQLSGVQPNPPLELESVKRLDH
jgi:hypothetical protein